MHFTLFTRRLVFGLLLVMTLVAGWLLHGMLFVPSNSTAAADVTALPVKDVSFYDWRGELLSGWLALITPEAPVIVLTHGTPGNRMSMLQRAAFHYKHLFLIPFV
jgi:hypothetical protein